MFSAKKGFFHFLFANPEEEFYLDSLVKLSFKGYLFYLLKQEGYQGIFFIEGQRGKKPKYSVTAMDPKSSASFGRPAEKGFFNIWNPAINPSPKSDGSLTYGPMDAKKLLERMKTLLSKEEEPYAFVFPIQAFSELFSSPERIAILREYTGENHILIIESTLSASVSRRFLMDPEGVFGSGLFPELRPIYDIPRAKLYEELEMAYGSRCCFFHPMERENLLHMLRFMMLFEKRHIGYWEELPDYADFLYAWYHSEAFSGEHPLGLTRNTPKTVSALFKMLTDNIEILDEIDYFVQRLRSQKPQDLTLLSIIRQTWNIREEKVPVIGDEKLLEHLEKVDAQWLLQETERFKKAAARETLDKFSECRREIQIPRTEPIEKNRFHQLYALIGDMKKAEELSYPELFQESVSAFLFGVTGAEGVDADTEETIFDFYLDIVKYTKNKWNKEQTLSEIRSQIEVYNRKIESLFHFLQEKELTSPSYGVLPGDITYQGISADTALEASEKEKLTNLHRQRENLKFLLSQENAVYLQYDEAISRLKQTIFSLTGQDVDAVLESLKKASDILADYHFQMDQHWDSLEELKNNIDSAIRESAETVLRTPEDTEREYQRIKEAYRQEMTL